MLVLSVYMFMYLVCLTQILCFWLHLVMMDQFGQLLN